MYFSCNCISSFSWTEIGCVRLTLFVFLSFFFFFGIHQDGPDEVKFMPDITSYSGAAGSYFGKITCTCGKCEPRCIVKWITNELYTTNSSSLEFEQLSISNTGQYMCYCINQDTAKTVTKGFQMHVQGKKLKREVFRNRQSYHSLTEPEINKC